MSPLDLLLFVNNVDDRIYRTEIFYGLKKYLKIPWQYTGLLLR
jgi:hypothetical protein